MFSVHVGSSRLVILCGPVALKLPRDQRGRQCNQFEAGIWERNHNHPSRGPRLCPVLWSHPEGHVLIMRAAEPVPAGTDMSPVLVEDWWNYLAGEDDDWPCEPKDEDWGMLDGRVVAVDYAAAAL